MRRPLDYIFLLLKGFILGITEVLHGISAGTLAIGLGIYEELVVSFLAMDRPALQLLKEKKISAFWKKINGNFLITVMSGIVLGILTLLPVISFLLSAYFIPVSSFFFSVAFMIALLLLRKVRKWDFGMLPAAGAGVGISLLLTMIPPAHTPDGLFFALIAGMVSFSTLLIPGVSASFILLLIGKYQYILASFNEGKAASVTLYLVGGLLGCLGVSRIIRWIFARNYNIAVALLAGLMFGALNKAWPWRRVLEYTTNARGERIPSHDTSMLPWEYVTTTGKDPQVFGAVLMMAMGIFMVVLADKIAVRFKTKF